MTNGARFLYDDYLRNGYAGLRSLIGSEVETHIQEFKLFKGTGTSNINFDTSDKRNLSAALSGFANSAGGVVVWGVYCARVNDADVVQNLVPIKNLSAVLGQMYSLTAQLISPAIEGVEHERIEDPGNPDSGFIVSFIPQTDSPRMAMWSGGHQYMYRSGSSFLPMAEWMVGDRYGRRPQPKLKLTWSIDQREQAGRDAFVIVRFDMENYGLAMAKYPGFVIYAEGIQSRPTYPADLPKDATYQHGSEELVLQCGNQTVVFPSRKFRLLMMRVSLPLRSQIRIKYDAFCDGFYGSGDLTIAPEDVN